LPRDGVHILGIDKQIQTGADAGIGDKVKVALEEDNAPRTVEPPADLVAALNDAPAQKKIFEALSYSHKKEFVDWIESAKKPETRERRIAGTLEMLTAKRTPKG
jgi:uncharacterized protein YdeI (YjbR/CyaY-like superfamily)